MTNMEDRIRDRRLELELEEFAGRATPPDRLDEILARAAHLPADPDLHALPTPPRNGAGNLVAAALVLLAVGVTATIFGWKATEDGSPAGELAQTMPAQGKEPPEPPQGKGATGKKAGEAEESKPRAGEKKEGKPPEGKEKEAVESTREWPPKDLTVDPGVDVRTARIAELRARMRAVEQELRAKKELDAVVGKVLKAGGQDGVVRPDVELQKRVARLSEVLRRNQQVRDPLVRLASAATGPMHQGDAGQAMSRITKAVTLLSRATTAEEAQKHLDTLQRAVDETRKVVWEMKKKEKAQQDGAAGKDTDR